MNKIILLIGLFTYSSLGWSNELFGKFDCKVLDVKLTVVKEGRSSTYQGWKNGWEVGDEVTFSYSNDYEYVNFEVSHLRKGRTLWSSVVGPTSDMKINFPLDGSVISRSNHVDINFSSDEIQMTQTTNSGNVLLLRRYYKNDWGGFILITDYPNMDPMFSTTSINCRHSIDDYESLLDHFKRMKDS